jgi:hypothetical protein
MARADTTDDPTQTTPIGLYNYAVSYRAAANLIAAQGLKAFHPEAPTQSLYFHAIELYLKSFLRLHGFSLQQLIDINHNFGKMRSGATGHGLTLGDAETKVLNLLSKAIWSRARYIVTTAAKRKALPSSAFLSRACEALEKSVGKALSASAHAVRGLDTLPHRKPR